MSIRETKRANVIEKDFEDLTKNCARAVSELAKQTALVKILIPFMHDNILSGKGDIAEEDRQDQRDALVPMYTELNQLMAELVEVFQIHDDDISTWQQNLDSYVVKYPNSVLEAELRYPSVG